MGILNVVEISRLIKDESGNVAPIIYPNSTGVNVTTSGTTARTVADFDADTKAVMVTSDSGDYIKFGDETVEAAAGDIFIPAGVPMVFGLKDGQTRVAAINK